MTSLPERVHDAEEARRLPPGLWDRLKADPVRAPEHLALAAAERHGPAAAEWLAAKRDRYAHDPHELARMAKRRHAAMARFEGAATGVGGFITVVPDMVALAWIQSRLVFFVAAAYGFDPHDPMRPAELLVLRDLYPDPETARRALDGVGRTVAEAYVGGKLARGRDKAVLGRLMQFVGKRTATRAARRLIPGVAIAFNAIANERDTRALADRAIAFYGG
jgi:EcsC protein family